MHWNPLDELVEECAFSGVVRVRRQGQPMYERAAGFADRANSIANTAETRFGIASGTKLLTALTVGRLIDAGRLALTTQVRDCISVELPGLLSGHHHPASAYPHLRDSRLLRRRAHRGYRQFHRRYPLVRAKRSEGLSAGVPTTGDEVCTGGRVLVLQRRLHPARCSGGRGNGEAFSGRRRRGDPQASKNGSLWILRHEPTTGMHRPWLHRRRRELADEHLQPAHRRCLGRRFVLDADRHRGSLGTGSGTARSSPRNWCVPSVRLSPMPAAIPVSTTDTECGFADAQTELSSTISWERMPVSPSSLPSTVSGSWTTRSFRTLPRARGRLEGLSTTFSEKRMGALAEHGAFFVAHVEDIIGDLRLMIAGRVGLERWTVLVDQRAALVFALPY